MEEAGHGGRGPGSPRKTRCMKDKTALAHRLLGHAGGFTGKAGDLVASVDGVGTKALLAETHDDFVMLGWDAIAANINDVLVDGVPLFAMDYIGIGEIDWRVDAIVQGATAACRHVGISLVGGETAEMPSMYGDHVSVVGMVVGRKLADHDIQAGDTLIGVPSNGVHANGFTLIRERLGLSAKAWRQETRIYYSEALQTRSITNGRAHISGGGIRHNLERIMPIGMTFDLSVPKNKYFEDLQTALGLWDEIMASTFNMGIGFVLVTREPDEMLKRVPDGIVIGEVRAALEKLGI